MARSTIQLLVIVLRRPVVGANRVIGTKHREINGPAQVHGNFAASLHQSTEGAFGVRGTGVDQNSLAAGVRIHTLPK